MKKLRFLPIMLLLIMCMFVPVQAASAPKRTDIYMAKAMNYNKIRVYWHPVCNATEYKVYYKVPGGKWKYVGKSTKNYYTHTSKNSAPIVVGQTYYYTVRTYDSSTGKAGSYNKAGTSVNTIPERPTMRSVWQVSNTVKITWQASYGNTHYAVYRKKEGGSWKKIALVSAGATSYTDKKPYFGEKAYYTVKAYNSNAKLYSKIATGISITASYSNPDDRFNTTVPDYYIPDQQVGYMKVGFVNYKYVNMRSDHEYDAPIVVKLRYNDRVEVEVLNGDFYLCRAEHYGRMYWGFVHKDYITFGFPRTYREGVVNYTYLRVRETPTTSADVVVQLSKNDRMLLLEHSGCWYKVVVEHLGEYYEGYVSDEYVDLI